MREEALEDLFNCRKAEGREEALEDLFNCRKAEEAILLFLLVP